jgi:cytidylate kinase
LNTQRDIAKSNSVIMDGRDIGTVILPNADVKIFLTASLENRAQRRYDELSAKGIHVNFEDVLREMKERDANDSGRSVAPAVAAEDAIVLDNTGFTVDQSSNAVMEIIKGKLGDI